MNDREARVRYQIHNKSGMYTLYSVVKTRFGGDARNYVTQSTDLGEVERVAVSLGAKGLEYVG
jgi:hypothetical protein